MTSWKPELPGRNTPIYLAIVSALAEDIAAGRLTEGTRLPTHRELADALGVTVGTVTRAYAEAHRRGLVSGEVGRGTFVRGKAESPWLRITSTGPELTDLSLARPVAPLPPEEMRTALERLARDGDLRGLTDYQPDAGMLAHRAALAEWLRERGLEMQPGQIAITSGAENAIVTVLAALAHPDDTVVCEALTYPGVRAVSAMQHLRLQGLAMDEEGLLPDAFEHACRTTAVRVLYTIPTLQNPTSAVMPLERRRAIAEIARRYGVMIVEDEVYGFLEPDAPPPIAALAPERTFYLGSCAKLLGGGMRVGYVAAPPELAPQVTHMLHTNLIVVAPLLAELAARFITGGIAQRQVTRQREEARRRQQAAARLLAGLTFQARPTSPLLWLHLPPPWRPEVFAAAARQQGILVGPAPLFHAGRGEPLPAVRLGLGGASGDALERALVKLAALARSAPEEMPRIV